MKLLIGAFIFVGILLVMIFGGMAANQPVILMISCMVFTFLGNPLLWIAIYRLVTGAAGGRIQWVSNGQQPPAKKIAPRSIGADL